MPGGMTGRRGREGPACGHVLAIAAKVQAIRDSRYQAGPSRTMLGESPRPHHPASRTNRQRLINRLDLEWAIASTRPAS